MIHIDLIHKSISEGKDKIHSQNSKELCKERPLAIKPMS